MKRAWIVIFLLMIQGCVAGSQFHVNIDSLNAPGASSKLNYILFSGLKSVSETDLRFKEYARYTDKTLVLKGYKKTEIFENADIAVFLSYGIGTPKDNQQTISVPIIGQTGISSSNTYGTLNTYGNTTTFSGNTTYTPTYGITGTSTYTRSYTTFDRFIRLVAVDLEEFRKSKKQISIWETTITSTGTSGDLRRVFPVMIAASKPYIGSNTGRQIKVVLTESDKRVIDIIGKSKDPILEKPHYQGAVNFYNRLFKKGKTSDSQKNNSED